jgi:hypothetical protein
MQSLLFRQIILLPYQSYDNNMRLGGLVYLHDISQARMLGTTRKNFDMFRKLCGEHADKSVILGTTKWREVLPAVGERREGELKSKYWAEMISAGSKTMRFDGTSESAWDIINIILDFVEETDRLQIQHELVELSRYIPETEAGKTLRYTLEQLLEMQKRMTEELKAQTAGGDSYIREKLEDNRKQMTKTLKQVKDLQVSIPRRIMHFFRLTVSGYFLTCYLTQRFF